MLRRDYSPAECREGTAISGLRRHALGASPDQTGDSLLREITVEHLLLAVLREEPSLLSEVRWEAVVRAIEGSEPTGRRVPQMEKSRLTDEAIRVIAAAREIAHVAGDETPAWARERES